MVKKCDARKTVLCDPPRPGDEGKEPPQIYGSNQLELAWTLDKFGNSVRPQKPICLAPSDECLVYSLFD
jgi:hypothetical protein